MSEPMNNDAEGTSKVHTSWLLTDRVDHLERVVTHLLESHKDMLEYFTEAVTAIKEISAGDSEE